MVRMFLDWWGRQLRDVLPASGRRTGGTRSTGDAVLLTLLEPPPGERQRLAVVRRRGRRDTQLGSFLLDADGMATLRAALGSPRRGSVRLILPPGLLLEQQVTLPLAAERGLDTVLRWEMDRLTPFPVEAVFWNWHVEQRDRARGKLMLRLRLVPKAAVAHALEALATSGLAPTLLASATDPAAVIPMSGPGRVQRDTWMLAASGAVFAMAMAAVAIPFVRQEVAIRRIDERVDALRPEIGVSEAFRWRLVERAASADIVGAESARVGDVARILMSVTDALPDDTSLSNLTLRNRSLTLTGQSAAAARLIPALAADTTFQDPAFAAPVTRNEITGTEAFTIRSEVRP